MVKKLLQGLIPSILALAILAALVWYGDVNKVVAVIERFQRIYLLWYLLLMLAHQALRGALWLFLLRSLDIQVPLRTGLFAFAVGEAATFVPTGTYLQNLLLQRSKGTAFGRSSAATTVIIVAEIAVAVVGALIMGLGAWSTWLRPAIVIAMVVLLLGARGIAAWYRHPRAPRWVKEHKILRRALYEFKRFREGTAALLHPRIVLVTLLLSAAYVIAGGASLYLVVRALGIGGISFEQVLAVSFFSLAFYLILGSLQAAAVGAFIVMGVSKSAAVSAIVVNHGLSAGGTLALSLLAMVVLHDEFRAALRTRRAKAPERAPAMAADHTSMAENPSEPG